MIIKNFIANLFLVLFFFCQIQNKVTQIEIEKHGDHFHNIFEYNYVIAIFQRANSNDIERKNIKKMREEIANLEFLQQEKIAVEFIDFAKDDYLDKHYKFGDKNGFALFIKNQMINFKQFQDIVEKEGFNFDPIKEFLHTKIEGISKEIYTLENLDQILHEHNIIGLFVGERNKQFKTFFQLARNNIDFNFYHSFNKDILKDLEIKFNKKISLNSFSIIRHDTLLDDFDSSQIIVFDKINELNELKKFFEFERHPKLRDSTFYSETLQDILWKDHKVLLYVKDRKVNEKNLQVFKNTLKQIPKKFIFKIVEIGSEDWRHVSQLLEFNRNELSQETVCIIYADEDKKIKAEIFGDFFQEEKLIKFTQNYENFEPIKQQNNFNDEL